jgi:hypothetical protein
MKHKLSKLILLTTALCALLTLTAFAAEGEETGDEAEPEVVEVAEVQEIESVEYEDVSTVLFAAPTVDAVDWNWSNTEFYGDQLSGTAAKLYQMLERSFQDGSLAEKRVTIEYVDENDEVVGTGIQLELGIAGYTMYDETLTGNYADLTIGETGEEKLQYVAESAISAWRAEYEDSYTSAAVTAFYALTYDHPDYYWVRTSLDMDLGKSYSGSAENGTYSVHVQVTLGAYFIVTPECTTSDGQLDRSYDNDLTAAFNEIWNGMDENWSDVAKMAYFDNWLAANNAYNSNAADNDTSSTDSSPWSILSGLLSDRSPVCEGYAKSFQYLCREVGIPCVTVSSKDHMWNAVRLNGQWYYVDCTWDDPVVKQQDGSYTSHDYSNRNYFLVTSFSGGDSQGSHTISMSFTPPTVSGSDYFDSWSQDKSVFLGSKTDGGAYWVALYTGNGQMISCQQCQTFDWDTHGENALYFCNFDSSVLSAAATAKQFYLNTTTWAPITT